MLNFILLILVLVCVCVALMWLGSWRIITPPACVGYTVLIYYVFKLIWNFVFKVEPLFNLQWADFVFPFSLLVGILILVGFSCVKQSFEMANTYKSPHLPALAKNIQPSGVRWHFWLAYFLSPVVCLVWAWRAMGFWAWESPIAFRAFIQSGGMMYLYVFTAFCAQLGVFFIIKSILVDKKIPHVLALLGFPVVVLYSLNTGFTSTIIAIFLPSVYYLSFRKGWRFELFLPIAIPLAGFFALSHLLYKRDAGGEHAQTYVQAVMSMQDNPDWDYGFMNRLDYPEQYVLAVNHVLGAKGPDWGENLVGVFTQPFPRAFWPEKPLTFSAYMSRELHPDNFYAGITANFGGVAELINAFGVLGCLLAATVLAAYVKLGNSIFKKACYSDYHLILYLFGYFPLLMGSISGAFFNDLSSFNFLINYFLIWIFMKKPAVLVMPKFRPKLPVVLDSRIPLK